MEGLQGANKRSTSKQSFRASKLPLSTDNLQDPTSQAQLLQSPNIFRRCNLIWQIDQQIRGISVDLVVVSQRSLRATFARHTTTSPDLPLIPQPLPYKHIQVASYSEGNMSNQQVGAVYQSVISDVIDSSRVDFEEGGVEESVLEELKLVCRHFCTFP